MTAREANEIVSTRTLAASRERVWRAFADPTQLAQWWGPAGFTNTFHEFDLRAGGVWRYTMTGPDSTRYEQTRKVVELASLERIVIENPDPAHRFRMTMTFAPNVDGTLVSWRMSFDSSDEFARVKDFIVGANEENFDRLAALLAEES
jgi:uncharacterized protein YndB with AHSA1/START domain